MIGPLTSLVAFALTPFAFDGSFWLSSTVLCMNGAIRAMEAAGDMDF